MRQVGIYAVFFAVLVKCARSQDAQETPETSTDARLAAGEVKLSENIMKILEHFKQEDPVGLPAIPGMELPEPFPVPDMSQHVSVGTMHFKNNAVYGLNKFRILNINTEVSSMQAQAKLLIEKVQARGNYTLSMFLGSTEGPYTIDITGLVIKAYASIGVERDGKLRAQEIKIDLSFQNMAVDFKNLGFWMSSIQALINTSGNFIFDTIKPFILQQGYATVRTEINEKLEDITADIQFPNSISALDTVVIDIRQMIRDKKMDPYQLEDRNQSVGLIDISLTNTWITGASSIQRVGNITLKLENNTLIADFAVGSQKLVGQTQWDISAVAGLLSKTGIAIFSVEYVNARIILGQPLDTRKKPEFKELDVDVGNIQIRFDGAGTLDYAVELLVNVVPNLLRYQIMDICENVIKHDLQSALDTYNIEQVIAEQLPVLDKMQTESGFKLSTLKKHQAEMVYDEDEFFNF